jgi:surfactin synthase thioesterase subunit
VAIIVVPAFETVLHVYHKLRRNRERSGTPEGLSAEEAERLMGAELQSFTDGIVRVGGTPTKYWMREELMATLAEQNLDVRRIRKVEYPWTEEIENPPGWLEGAQPWDWLVVCEA